MSSVTREFRISEKARTTLAALATAGVILLLAGFVADAPRAWANLLISGIYLTTAGLAGIFFVALLYVTKSGWSAAVRRVPEAMGGLLPLAAVVVLVALAGGAHALYEWSHEDAVAKDALLRGKSGWLNPGFFLIRAAGYFAAWMALAALIRRTSRAQDATGDVSCTVANTRYSAIFLVVFAPTFSLAAFDWLMSLTPHWYSTIFGLYAFSGMFLTGLALVTVLVVLLRKAGPLAEVVTENHLHDLGKLLFSFATFWMYLWFSQYMLIWYSNIPEETAYYAARHDGAWGTVSMVSVCLNWAIPFFVLLPRHAKRNDKILLQVAGAVLVGHAVDLYWMIVPTVAEDRPLPGLCEAGALLGVTGIMFLTVFRSFGRARAVPVGDPYLQESLNYQQ